MATLSEAVLELRLPGEKGTAADVFAPSVEVVDLGPGAEPGGGPGAGASRFETSTWPVQGKPERVAKVDLWRPLLDRIGYFEHADFRLRTGEHPGGDMYRFDAEGTFDGLARMRSGEWRAIQGRLKWRWGRERRADGKAGAWRITDWHTEALSWIEAPKRYFADVLDRVMRTPEEAAAMRRSEHEEATVRYYREGMKKPPHPYFAPISVNQKEGIAVADVNGDGFDDLYVPVRLGKNLLLINRGDGTYAEEGEAYGLALPGHTTCALFADFDNDGDLDAMLGRSLLRSTYLENRGGRYFQASIPKFMPMAVISMAAADYNGDGLLDVYLCTYRPTAPAGAGTGGAFAQAAKEGDFDWPDEFFPPDQAREFRRRLAEHRQQQGASVLDQLGPPNLLLVNRGGGRFEPAPENATVGLWRNSLQATWCDYNLDGRPDLYIPNDWGLNVLFRNDGAAGFKDVTADLGLTYYGFSMGASWGDYDNDGRDDLYVSNMSSDAGRRQTARLPGIDKTFVESAMGNWLYHQEADGRFSQVAGPTSPAMTVMNAGWSWGGCFADFDNDSYLDLYVVNGYFTAPEELASGLDLESNLWRTMVRSDAHLARPSFRFSPEWRRTPAPDALGPQIDARLAGVERIGDRILVHSLHGRERNRYFANRGGRSFVDASGLSGLDSSADGRGFAVLDYDRDGWQDVALINAHRPLFGLYRNEMASAGFQGGMIALRFRGGNRGPGASSQYACRDGYGARVTVNLGDRRITREHRCGEGWSSQNSATLSVGLGAQASAESVDVRWPSGKVVSTRNVPEGTLLTVYENPEDAPSGTAFEREAYRVRPPAAVRPPPAAGPVFAVRSLDLAAKPARLRVYTSFATSQPGCVESLPLARRHQEELRPEGVDFVLVPIDPTDDDTRLSAFHRQWKPTARLINLPTARRADVATSYAAAVGKTPPVPSTVVTDGDGRLLWAQPGFPSLSALRRRLAEAR